MAHNYPSSIYNLFHGFRQSKAFFTAIELGIFDLLEAEKFCSVSKVATSLNIAQKPCQMLLDLLTELGLLERQSMDGNFEEVYQNTKDASVYLVRESPKSLASYAIHSNRLIYPLFGRLEEGIRSGTNQLAATFPDLPKGGDIFDKIFNIGSGGGFTREDFNLSQFSDTYIHAEEVIKGFNFSQLLHVCDVGGGYGGFIFALQNAYPSITATVFDRADVCKEAKEWVPKQSPKNQIDFVEGDFFKDDIPKADLYILSKIIHDWSDADGDRILANLSRCCPEESRILLMEMVLTNDRRGCPIALTQSLNMLVQCEGHERREDEYRELLKRHGFTDMHVYRPPSPVLYQGIIATRKA